MYDDFVIEGSGLEDTENLEKKTVIHEVRQKYKEVMAETYGIELTDEEMEKIKDTDFEVYVSDQNYQKDYEHGEYGTERKGRGVGSSTTPPYEKI